MRDKANDISVTLCGRLGSFTLDCSFKVPARGVTALFGSSGCGKTSILRCIAGLQRVPGKISFGRTVWQDSKNQIHIPTYKRAVGYVFQEASLFPHLNVLENLLFGASATAQDCTVERPTLQDIIELFGLAHLTARSPAQLSGGERQRVTMGRALLSNPKLLLMDEPLSGLDRHTKEEILPYLDRLSTTLRIPMLYVSHDIEEVARLADQVIMMSNGSVFAEGASAVIMEHIEARNSEDREGLGAIVTAYVSTHDRDNYVTHLTLGAQTILMPTIDLAIGTAIRIYIKARDVSIATQRPSHISIRNILSGTIISLEPVYDSGLVDVTIDVESTKIRSQVTRAVVSELSLTAGQDVYALIKSVTVDPRSLGTHAL